MSGVSLTRLPALGPDPESMTTNHPILESCGIVQAKGLGELTVSQRAGLAAVLRARGAA